MNELNLDNIRSVLIRLEESIIFSLIERAQFKKNEIIYKDNGIKLEDFNGSYLKFLLHHTEVVHSMARRYTAPDEHPFTNDLPKPVIKGLSYDRPIVENTINLNNKILDTYIKRIIPAVCPEGDDGNYGSSAVNDITTLQTLSKRIHYGKFVAEAKFRQEGDLYKELAARNDREGIIARLSNAEVEKMIIERVRIKTENYGKDPFDKNSKPKIDPQIVQTLYRDEIIPLTKEIEYLYLMTRSGY